jgi:sugar (pentulose or hexulose) kinase
MTLLGIDLGTTHCKAGLFSQDSVGLKIVQRDNQVHRAQGGFAYFNPDEFWKAVTGAVSELVAWAVDEGLQLPQAVGIASMAESGLLVDRSTGEARTPIYPWFDQTAMTQAEFLGSLPDRQGRFYRHGIQPTFKCSLARILWLREQDKTRLERATWLSAADYIAYRLTGEMATDYSLAVRTYAFDLIARKWDSDLLAALDLEADLFPSLVAAGVPIGEISVQGRDMTGLPPGIPVAVTGHDHICGAFAAGMSAGGIEPGMIYDSIGTAESILGNFPERPLGEEDQWAGFSYGCHVVEGFMYWLGGLSTSGGSLEWLRGVFAEPALSYQDLDNLIEGRPGKPTGILYFPYLAGSGSPHSDSMARGTFLGLSAAHSRADLYQAILEGVAYEIEFMRRKAQQVFKTPMKRIVAAGGGGRNLAWMQIRADISGCQVDVFPQTETTLQGAALLAGLGSGYYTSREELMDNLEGQRMETYLPRPDLQSIYQELYERGFTRIQEPLRSVYGKDWN